MQVLHEQILTKEELLLQEQELADRAGITVSEMHAKLNRGEYSGTILESKLKSIAFLCEGVPSLIVMLKHLRKKHGNTIPVYNTGWLRHFRHVPGLRWLSIACYLWVEEDQSKLYGRMWHVMRAYGRDFTIMGESVGVDWLADGRVANVWTHAITLWRIEPTDVRAKPIIRAVITDIITAYNQLSIEDIT